MKVFLDVLVGVYIGFSACKLSEFYHIPWEFGLFTAILIVAVNKYACFLETQYVNK